MKNLIGNKLKGLKLPVRVVFWDGDAVDGGVDVKVQLTVKSLRAALLLLRPTLGKIAKAYVEGALDIVGDVQDILRCGEDLVAGDSSTYQRRLSLLKWWKHTRPADRRSIQHHYDVGNDFYSLWLDQNRVYSCGYFAKDGDSLDVAQEKKLDHICRKLNLEAGEKFLDIGCGWGGLVIWAAKNYGVHATGITLSEEQLAFSRNRIKQLGLQGKIEVRLMDYRDLPSDTQYDKIASVGMFEHVGRLNLPQYFSKIYSLLKPGGVVMNHGITTNSLDDHALGSDIGRFVDEYVFPGGELVHLSTVVGEMASQGIEVWDAESLRPHYAKTLWEWVKRLEGTSDQARELVGEKRFRIWKIYMAGSAHAFDRGWISIFQILGVKPFESGAITYPMTREHVYA
ncbi:MAG: cyclopropane-fatty-acyl-phospholipid synthase family protein [Betaproteobacteria bacterium]